MKKLLCILMVSALACSLLSACGSNRGGDSNTREIIGMDGSTATIPSKISSVYIGGASAIMLVATLGAADKIVCKPSAFESDTFAWARIICPAIDNVRVDDTAITNIEAVLNYAPDVVITIDKDDVERYAAVGFPVVYLSITDYDTMKEAMLILGAILGNDELEAAKKYNKYFDGNVAMVYERTVTLPTTDRKSVYYVDSRFSDVYHTVGTGEIQESWIEIAGATLATAGHFEGRNIEITAEKFLSIDPDILMVGAQNQAEVYDMLISEDLLSELGAVKAGQICRIPQGIFPWCRTGPEAALQVVWAGKLLHADLFEDIDITEMAKEFYLDFYGTEVSEENIVKILAGKLSPIGD